MPGLAWGWEKPACIQFPSLHSVTSDTEPFCANSFRMRSYKHVSKDPFLSPVECAVTSTLSDNSFRMCSYKK